MFLLFWYLCIMIENTFLLFLNLVSWYVNNIFLLQHDILILVIFIMFFVFLDSVFCIDHWCISFNWKFSCVFCDYDFLVFIIVFWLIFYIMTFLIIFFHFVVHIFRILVSNTDFISLFCNVLHICCCDMLFSVIICMSLI